ncbi:MAG: histidine kinase [Acidimicrobiales bacterium]|nr:MAG: histidine kinase [Acidimicrobiales bacterium]
MTTVADVMSRDLACVGRDDPLASAARTMVSKRVGSVLVTSDGSADGVLLGILTERDVLRAVAKGANPEATAVREWMTEDPATADPSTDTEEAAKVMLVGGFRHLPVVDAGRPIGMVSLRDVLSARIGRS